MKARSKSRPRSRHWREHKRKPLTEEERIRKWCGGPQLMWLLSLK